MINISKKTKIIYINGKELTVDMNKLDEAIDQADEFRKYSIQICDGKEYPINPENIKYWQTVYFELNKLKNITKKT